MRFTHFISASLAALAAASSAEPKNQTSSNVKLQPYHRPAGSTPVFFYRTLATIDNHANLLPLTKISGKKILKGLPVLNNASTKQTNLDPITFAVTSCDPANYTGEIQFGDVFQNAVNAKVAAILLYTLQGDYCALPKKTWWHRNVTIFSIYPKPAVEYLLDHGINKNYTADTLPAIAKYSLYEAYLAKIKEESGSTGSTAVAMIILYSITGLITALFLVIIVTGAIRAHRHPERYGPRNSLGRPRQSRAKGIARAMLDTIPIVKFGERDAQPNKDIESHELGNTDSPSNFYPAQSSLNGVDDTAPARDMQENVTPATNTTNTATAEATPDNDFGTDEGLGCSICTDDFQVGQDIRVLPCNHKFHPACVDPWLLEVSGTCPLCRVDLQPQGQQEGDPATTDDLPPPLADIDPETSLGLAALRRRSAVRNFVMSRIGRRNVTAEERIQVLRRWREANNHANPTAAVVAAGHQSSSPTQNGTESSPAAAAEADPEEDQQRRNSRLSALSRLVRRRDR